MLRRLNCAADAPEIVMFPAAIVSGVAPVFERVTVRGAAGEPPTTSSTTSCDTFDVKDAERNCRVSSDSNDGIKRFERNNRFTHFPFFWSSP